MIYIMRVSYGQIISIILVILLVYILYKIFKSYRVVKETFVGGGVGTDLSGVYGYNEDGEPFKFYITASNEIVPYIWRRDVSGADVWCQWYESSDISCSRIDAPFGLPEDTPTWDQLVDASSGYLMNRFEKLYLPNIVIEQKIRIEYDSTIDGNTNRHLIFNGLHMSFGDTYDSSRPITLFDAITDSPSGDRNAPISGSGGQFHSDGGKPLGDRYWECSYEIHQGKPYVIRITPRKNDGNYAVYLHLKRADGTLIETKNASWHLSSTPVDILVTPTNPIKDKFQQQYAQDKYIYNCTHPNEASCNIWYDGGNHFGQDCGGVTSSDNNPGYCWQPTADASYIPYFDRYENSRRGFFEKNKTNAAYDASLAMYDDIYDVSYSDTDAWREGTADTSINFYMGWNEGENNNDMMTQVMNPDGRYGYNIVKNDELQNQLPINRAASSVLTYNPGLNTFCGNVCFNGNEDMKVDNSAGVIE